MSLSYRDSSNIGEGEHQSTTKTVFACSAVTMVKSGRVMVSPFRVRPGLPHSKVKESGGSADALLRFLCRLFHLNALSGASPMETVDPWDGIRSNSGNAHLRSPDLAHERFAAQEGQPVKPT